MNRNNRIAERQQQNRELAQRIVANILARDPGLFDSIVCEYTAAILAQTEDHPHKFSVRLAAYHALVEKFADIVA